MAFSTTNNKEIYIGNGVTTVFDFPYLFKDSNHIKVYINGVESVSGFTVTGAGDVNGGEVTFSVAPSNGVTITLAREVPYIQETDFEDFDGNPAQVTEDQFDLIAMMASQLNEGLSRTILAPIDTTLVTNQIIGDITSDIKILGISTAGPTIVDIADLSTTIDTVLTSLTIGDILQWDGTNWVNVAGLGTDIIVDTATAETSAGIALKNNGGGTVLTLGASGGTGASFAGDVGVTGTLTVFSRIIAPSSSTGGAGFRIGHGTAPSSPVNGDIWTTTSGIFARINGVTKQLNDQTLSRFISPAQTITAAGSLTIAHSLGSNPVELNAYLTCTSADAGYSIGARVPYYPMAQGNVSATSNSGVTIDSDATNLNIRFGQSASPSTMFINHKTTGVLTGIANSSWTITFIARP